MADYEESYQTIDELEEQLEDAIDEYIKAHDDPGEDKDEAERHMALHHHSKAIAYTAQEILTHDPSHLEAQKFLAVFSLSLNGQFQPHHYRALGLVEEDSDLEELDHHPWKSEYLPDEDHSHLLNAEDEPIDAQHDDHHHHHNDNGEIDTHADSHSLNDGDHAHEECDFEKVQEHDGDEETMGGDDDEQGQYSGDEGQYGDFDGEYANHESHCDGDEDQYYGDDGDDAGHEGHWYSDEGHYSGDDQARGHIWAPDELCSS
ncbi:hypothetical protein AYO20_05287 [Fonsecaea nubica]|uniref:Uncharacterized protein n=1 Tax=Fonsecaea nubica TaxID=856822 RepID=A0A178D1A6_9EURO|nr:hypothetical protein AYO20_05287 [Fonsecaea nubica]OAL35437.1 hypothetical protein AYO20_05287 [Fonsecaea nubica]